MKTNGSGLARRHGFAMRIAALLLAGVPSQIAAPVAQAQVEVAQAEIEPAPPPDGAVGGMGDINLYPNRIVIDGRQRIASVGLFNKVASEGDYEIAISDMIMTPDGQILPLDSLPAEVSADRLKTASDILRWSPRRVTLRGNEAQTVRIMARPPSDLSAGEYRSHFSVTSIPRDVDRSYSIEDAVSGGARAENQIGVVIRPRFGLSIPVIVRVGETTLEVELSDAPLVNSQDASRIEVTIGRSGTRSAYGDLIVTMAGAAEPVALARGVGVYPEIDQRTYVLPLNPEIDASLLRQGAVLTVRFVDDDMNPGKTLATRDLVVP